MNDTLKIPWQMVAAGLALAVLPTLLNLVGVDFSAEPTGAPVQGGEAAFRHMRGAFIHTILEWSAVSAAFFTAALALVHYGIDRDFTTPIIGIALLAAGGADAVHTLAADRLISATADNAHFIPFTWAISRSFNAVIMTGGALIALRHQRGRNDPSMVHVLTLGFLFIILAFVLISALATHVVVPTTVFPDALIKRPFDIPPLVIFAVAGLYLFPKLYARSGSLFVASLIVVAILDVVTQIHMAFFSRTLFDNSFNVAHFLKTAAYIVPFAGLSVDYIQTYRREAGNVKRLDETLKQLEDEIEGRREADIKTESLARFPEENPNPVFRISSSGKVMYANAGASSLDTIGCQMGNQLPAYYRRIVEQCLLDGKAVRDTIENQGRYFLLTFTPITSGNYVNVYGVDVTEKRLSDLQLEAARVQEIEFGVAIQDMFLHGKPPENFDSASVAVLTLPSEKIDGDFVDFFPHGRRYLDVIVGDVMGKGIPAALLGAAIKSHFARALGKLRSDSQGALPSPAEIVGVVHRAITARLLALESFTTANYLRFDFQARTIRFVSCGHPSVVRYSEKDSKCSFLQGSNLPLGFQEEHIYEEHEESFDEGDLFVFCSDGVTEARDSSGTMFGADRLASVIQNAGARSPALVIEAVLKAVTDFTGSETHSDDLTVIVVRAEAYQDLPETVHETISLYPRVDELAGVRATIAQFCTSRWIDIPEMFVSQVQLAVQECLTNIMKHSPGSDKEPQTSLIMDGFVDRLSVRILYNGKPFRPGEPELPDLDSLPEGGFGLFIINNTVDTVGYFSEPDRGGAGIHLVKFLRGENAQHG